MAEVESLSQLKNHPNIVNLKQAFMEVDGTASLVFEFMEGNFWKLHCSFGNYNWIFAFSLAFNLTNLKSRGYPDEELETTLQFLFNYNLIFVLSFAFNLTNLKSKGCPDEELGGQEKSRTTQEKGNSKLDF
ncbi:unnamed protein product [Prunus brigantina]